MKIKVVIPCHLNSIRLEQKVLIDIHGLPMVEHVRRRALLSRKVNNVYVATGDDEIKNIIKSYGGQVLFTKNNHIDGTSRVSEAIDLVDCSHVILIQGDEPLLVPNYIDIFIENMEKSKDNLMWNGISEIYNKKSYLDHSIVKCTLDEDYNIESCFRLLPNKKNINKKIFKIQGLIGYEKKFLKKMVLSPETKIAKAESIEQMKAIEIGSKIKGILIPKSLPSVNTKEELSVVNNILNKDISQKEILNKIL